MKNGYGVWTDDSGDKYKGTFVKNKKDGYGEYYWTDGKKYIGYYKNDKKNGFGKYFWKDGTTYEGYFLNDLKHGEGIVSYGDGRTARLQWFEGAVVPRQKEKTQSSVKRAMSKNSSEKGDRKDKGIKGSATSSKGRQAKPAIL